MTDATYHPYIMPRGGVWRSFSAAFTSASLIRPPPMTSHMFHRTNAIGTLFSTFDCDVNLTNKSAPSLFFFNKKVVDKRLGVTKVNEVVSDENIARIAIIGGGIAGVTAAAALAKRLDVENKSAKIVLFEQDTEGGQRSVAFGRCQQPVWTAGNFSSCITLFRLNCIPMIVISIVSQPRHEMQTAWFQVPQCT